MMQRHDIQEPKSELLNYHICDRHYVNLIYWTHLKSCQDDARMGEIDNWTLVRVSTVWKSIKLLDINSWNENDVRPWDNAVK